MSARVDRRFAETRSKYPECFQCRAGCTSCCEVQLTLFPVEAERVARAVEGLPAETREKVREQAGDEERTFCPLLVEGRCAVYESRPLICRSHGLPVSYAEEGRREVDVCPLNFAMREIPEDAALEIDPLNELLAAINFFACRGRDIDPGQRVAIRDIARSA
jgi:Fe-S-cluster containining protein